ncbi:hypothetical protein CJ030_MR3G014728 [Morella rubra]|uniref:Uncharacterized protein n=1 Tax=Morella rubra TaxID=262757 RepID=A0A6A1VY40_9ROSI|nr:hypothetical protein CJ030_MR3G014728 [Morella rubra]
MAPGITEIQHSSHVEHKLGFTSAQSPFNCCGCKEIGFGSCYQCPKKKCKANFHLHEECASPPPSLKHPFFPRRDFTFEDCSPEKPLAFCVACGANVQGFRYQSSNEKPLVVLHPRCIQLPENTSSFSEVVNRLGVNLELRKQAPSKCLKCGKKELIGKQIKGWAYACNSESGKYCYHVACVRDSIVENWKKDYLQQQNNGKRNRSSSTASSLSMVIQHKPLTRRKAGTGTDFSAIAKLVLKFVAIVLLGKSVPSGAVDLVLEFPKAMPPSWRCCLN